MWGKLRKKVKIEIRKKQKNEIFGKLKVGEKSENGRKNEKSGKIENSGN